MGAVYVEGVGFMLTIVLLTALGVGGSTMLGALGGYCFRGAASRAGGGIAMAFAAGIMLSAAVVGLILPSLEGGSAWAVPVTVGGILAGGGFLLGLERLAARWQRRAGAITAEGSRVLLFVAAMAIHNLPEGLAAGVGFGTESLARALAIAGGIAAQNLPEGMVLVAPMLHAGVPPRRALALAMATGVVELIGVPLGYLAVSLSAVALPFLLAFAGGAMLFILCDDMLPACHGTKQTCALLLGFCLMLTMDYALG